MTDFSNSCFCVTPKNQALHEPSPVFHKATCIWKFVQRQLPHLGFRWRYRRILFGYQARIFHFSFFNVSHKSLSFITWNLIEYLHTQDFQRATAHLNVWTNILFCFASCMGVNNTQKYLNGIEEEETYFHASLSSAL